MFVIGSYTERIHIVIRKRQIAATWKDLRGTQEKSNYEILIPTLPSLEKNSTIVREPNGE